MRSPVEIGTQKRLAWAPLIPPQLYIGNLAAGLVTSDALRQVFDSALMAAFPEVRRRRGSMRLGGAAVFPILQASQRSPAVSPWPCHPDPPPGFDLPLPLRQSARPGAAPVVSCNVHKDGNGCGLVFDRDSLA